MFLSYRLPSDAPQPLVWYVVCDGKNCSSFIGPLADDRGNDQRQIVESAGWSYSAEHPFDLCEKCRVKAGR